MQILIEKSNFISTFFIKYLISILKILILKKLDTTHIQLFNYLVKEHDLFKKINNNVPDFNINKAIRLLLNNIQIISTKEAFIIKFNETIRYPGYYITVYDACKIFNYGALDIPPYPIITNAFMNLENNIKTYYARYIGRR